MAFKLNCLSAQGQGPADHEEPSGSRQRGGRSMSLTTSLAASSIGVVPYFKNDFHLWYFLICE